MLRAFLVGALVAGSGLFVLPQVAAAQRCESYPGPHPEIGDPTPSTPPGTVTREEARRLVRRFRGQYRSVRWATQSGDRRLMAAIRGCMNRSMAGFSVRRVRVSEVRERLSWMDDHGFSQLVIGDRDALPDDWVWEVFWGGQVQGFVTHGSVSGFLSPDGRTLLVSVFWPEG